MASSGSNATFGVWHHRSFLLYTFSTSFSTLWKTHSFSILIVNQYTYIMKLPLIKKGGKFKWMGKIKVNKLPSGIQYIKIKFKVKD